MTIQCEFDNSVQVQRLIFLANNELNGLIGQQVVAVRRLANPEAYTSRQIERAEKAVRALPEQIETMERAKKALSGGLNRARRDKNRGR